jgi:hypothetical protein
MGRKDQGYAKPNQSLPEEVAIFVRNESDNECFGFFPGSIGVVRAVLSE